MTEHKTENQKLLNKMDEYLADPLARTHFQLDYEEVHRVHALLTEKVTKEKRIISAIDILSRGGLYPKEVFELSQAYIEEYNQREVYQNSPRVPIMDDLITLVKAHAKAGRAMEDERKRLIDEARTTENK